MIDTWWSILMGSIGGLILGIALISLFVYLRRVQFASTEEKKRILDESERKYSILFNNVSDIIYVHDIEGNLIEVNEAGARLNGSSPRELTGSSIANLLNNPRQADVAAYLDRFSRGESEARGVFSFFHHDSSKVYFFEYQSSLLIDNQRSAVVQGIARNVTDRIHYERFLKKRERQMRILLDKAEQMRENLRLVSKEMMKVQEDERRKIGRELHDELGQMVATINVNLELIKSTIGQDSQSPLGRGVYNIDHITSEMFLRIRKFLRELKPVSLKEKDLIPAIRLMLHDFSQSAGIDASITGAEYDSLDLTDEKRIILYRIVQESLTNISKHANAKRVIVGLQKTKEHFIVNITDDGKGFDRNGFADPQHHNWGMGLLGMQERLNLINGEFAVQSAPGRGTSITAKIPLNGSH